MENIWKVMIKIHPKVWGFLLGIPIKRIISLGCSENDLQWRLLFIGLTGTGPSFGQMLIVFIVTPTKIEHQTLLSLLKSSHFTFTNSFFLGGGTCTELLYNREVLYPCRSHVALLFACLSHPPSAGHRMSCPRSGATVSGTKVGTTLGAAGGLPAGRNGSCFHQKSKYQCTTRTLGTIWRCFFFNAYQTWLAWK